MSFFIDFDIDVKLIATEGRLRDLNFENICLMNALILIVSAFGLYN